MTQRIHVTCLALLAIGVSIAVRSEILLSANDGKATLVDGKLATRADAVPDSVTIIRIENDKAVAVADIAVATSVLGPPFSIAITPDERIALVSAPEDLVSVLDLTAKPPRVKSTVNAGKGATGISITPDGKLALVANRFEGSVSVLAIEDGAVRKVDTLQIGTADSGLGHVAISPDGKLALASRTGDDTLSVLAIDGQKVTDTKRDFGVGMKPYGIAIARDASIAVVANVSLGRGDIDTLSVVDLRTSPIRTVDTVSVGQTPEGVALSPDGKWCAIAVLNGSNKSPSSPFYNPAGKVELFRIDGVKLTRVSELPTGAWPQGAAFASDSKTLFVGSMTERSIRIFKVGDEGSLADTGQRIPLKGGNAALRTQDFLRSERMWRAPRK